MQDVVRPLLEKAAGEVRRRQEGLADAEVRWLILPKAARGSARFAGAQASKLRCKSGRHAAVMAAKPLARSA